MYSHSMKNHLNISFPLKISIYIYHVVPNSHREKKDFFSTRNISKNLFRKISSINNFLFQHRTERTIYRMSRRSCDIWPHP
uniref:Uncharacterized protein n=1 Tax=Populus trichocarpa TaxID=3694 RepID=A0A2K1RA57_POPTR